MRLARLLLVPAAALAGYVSVEFAYTPRPVTESEVVCNAVSYVYGDRHNCTPGDSHFAYNDYGSTLLVQVWFDLANATIVENATKVDEVEARLGAAFLPYSNSAVTFVTDRGRAFEAAVGTTGGLVAISASVGLVLLSMTTMRWCT